MFVLFIFITAFFTILRTFHRIFVYTFAEKKTKNKKNNKNRRIEWD